MRPVGAYNTIAAGRGAADALVARHAELVKRIAWHLAGRLPPSVEVDDLIQAGMIGLLEAAGHYSPDRGASFETYAGIRIRGAMIDALRKLDWAPRSVHRKARDAAKVVRVIEEREGAAFREDTGATAERPGDWRAWKQTARGKGFDEERQRARTYFAQTLEEERRRAKAGESDAAKTLAATMVDLFERPELRAEVRAEFEQKTAGKEYRSYLAPGPPPLPAE